jgi:hypothetical protein
MAVAMAATAAAAVNRRENQNPCLRHFTDIQCGRNLGLTHHHVPSFQVESSKIIPVHPEEQHFALTDSIIPPATRKGAA